MGQHPLTVAAFYILEAPGYAKDLFLDIQRAALSTAVNIGPITMHTDAPDDKDSIFFKANSDHNTQWISETDITWETKNPHWEFKVCLSYI